MIHDFLTGRSIAVALAPPLADGPPLAHRHGADERIHLDAAAAALRQPQG